MLAVEFWRLVLAELEAGRPAFIACVADHTRHSPGKRGARMLLTLGGEQRGTIGGGVMELNLLARGRQALSAPDAARSPSCERLFHRKDAPGLASGLICAGEQVVVSGVLMPDAEVIFALGRACALMASGRFGLLQWAADGVLSAVEEADVEAAPEAFVVRVVEEGAAAWMYQEQTLNLNRVAIFGAGHCGLALSRQMKWLGFDVSVLDVRAQLPTLEENVWADRKLTGADFSELAQQVPYPALTWAVVMTADFPSDTRALLGALRQPFVFVGVMGAPAKLRAIKQALSEQGVSQEALSRLTAPVGLPISSATPEEIAVSVSAQILALRPERFGSFKPTPF